MSLGCSAGHLSGDRIAGAFGVRVGRSWDGLRVLADDRGDSAANLCQQDKLSMFNIHRVHGPGRGPDPAAGFSSAQRSDTPTANASQVIAHVFRDSLRVEMNERLRALCESWDLHDPSLMASTFTSDVFKVRFQRSFAVLKILNEKGMAFETNSAIALRCFEGNGAVQLFRSDEGAQLLEFADGSQLKSLIAENVDSRATEIISDVVSRLHRYSGPIPTGLIRMERNFQSLFLKAKAVPLDSIYVEGAKRAEYLLETERDLRVLHGDIHHENIVSSSGRGWLAIDPQCLFGERTYDLANTFFNPDEFRSLVEASETIDRRSSILSQRLEIDRKRILEFAFVYGCLSACWSLEDGRDEKNTLRMARNVQRVLQNLDN